MNKTQQKGYKRRFAGFTGNSGADKGPQTGPLKMTGDGISGKSPDGESTESESTKSESTGTTNLDDTRQEAGLNGQGCKRTDTSTEDSAENRAEKSTNKSTNKSTEKRTEQETETGMTESAMEDSTERGRFELMQYIHGFIACLLVLLAVIHVPFPEPFAWLPYSVAAALAVLTLKSEISIPVSRVLAIATTGMMFFFFALFFLVVPTLKEGWYTTQYGWAAVCLLLSAFVMIPILSDYSCRLKADCREARAARRTAFFSVPSHINPESR